MRLLYATSGRFALPLHAANPLALQRVTSFPTRDQTPRSYPTQRVCTNVHALGPSPNSDDPALQTVRMQAQDTRELPGNLKKIVGSFQMVPDPMARYKQLLFFASKLDPLPPTDHTEENRVIGCVSQVWVKAQLEDGTMQFQADSDSQMSKGLAALLVQGLSGCSPQEVLQLQPDFIEMLGLKQSLMPSRTNGFLNMFRMMQKRTLQLVSANLAASAASDGKSEGGAAASGNGAGDPESRPVEASIRQKLTAELQPEELTVTNESEQHAGHAGNPNDDPETHFRLRIVSSQFEGLNAVQRHRRVYSILQEELAGPVHACALETKTPAEI